MALSDTSRQRELLDRLARYVGDSNDLGAMVLLGSFARATADALSDLDLFFITYEGRFEHAWERRRELRVTGSLVHWDEGTTIPGDVRGHRWVTPDLVVVESVISAPRGGGRLADPFEVVVGDADLVENFPRRPAIDRSEMTDERSHPIDVAYTEFKRAVRAASR